MVAHPGKISNQERGDLTGNHLDSVELTPLDCEQLLDMLAEWSKYLEDHVL